MVHRDGQIKFRRCAAAAVAVILAFCGMPAGAFADTAGIAGAADETKPFVKEGTYRFTVTMDATSQIEDTFVYRDEYFTSDSMRSSARLAELSIQAALASVSCYEANDYYTKNPEPNGDHIVQMLQDMGFDGVETNDYYRLEELENSMAVAIGSRKLQGDGKSYTLLAVFPRSGGYKEEWSGDVDVGDQKIHEGFRLARDEVLRYIRQYVQKNGITGEVKLWIAGHSRGAAIANLVAGFFADGGTAYLGKGIRIRPQDIYCYGYATPNNIREGLTRAEELSVSGSRGGRYSADTPAEAYISDASGKVDPDAKCFRGIHNYNGSTDLVPRIPPTSWGYRAYGKTCLLSDKWEVTGEEMRQQLRKLSPNIYDEYLQEGITADFTVMTPDAASLSLKPVEDADRSQATADMEQFLSQLITGLAEPIGSPEAYVQDGGQDALRGIAGTFGKLLMTFKVDPEELTTQMAPVAAEIYLAYASERLQAEGRVSDETEAIAYALADLTNVLTGDGAGETVRKPRPESMTVDQFFAAWAGFVGNHPDSPAVEVIRTMGDEMVPADTSRLLSDALGLFLVPGYRVGDRISAGDLLVTILKACSLGPEPGTGAATLGFKAKRLRTQIYNLCSAGLREQIPGIDTALSNNGRGSLAGLVGAVQPLLMDEGKTPGQMADDSLTQFIDKYVVDAAKRARKVYGGEYYQDSLQYIDALRGNVTQVRTLLSSILFCSGDAGFSAKGSLEAAATLAGHGKRIILQHYPEVYLSWMRADRIYIEDRYPDPATGTMVVKVKKPVVKIPWKKIKKSKQRISGAISYSKSQGTVKYKKVKVNKRGSRFTVNARTGKITVRKGTKKGTYKVRIRVTASGDAFHLPVSKTVTVKIVIR